MATRSSTLLMQLIDGVTGPAAQISNALGKTERAARSAGKGLGPAGLLGTSMGKLGAIAAGYATAQQSVEAVQAFAKHERSLERIGVLAGATTQQMKAVGGQLHKIAQEFALPREQIEAAFAEIVQGGDTIESAMKQLPYAAVAAQAYGLNIKDVENTNRVMMGQMGIAQDRLVAAWDAISAASHQGNVEIGDFAKTLPEVMAQAARIGGQGEETFKKVLALSEAISPAYKDGVSAIQAVGGAYEAMYNKRTIAALQKAGVNLPKELARAAKEGKDPLERFFTIMKTMTKGDWSKVGLLTQNSELQTFMWALDQARGNLRNLQSQIKFGTGDTMATASRITGGAQASLDRLANSWQGFKESFGQGLVDLQIPEGLQKMASLLREAGEAYRYLREHGSTPRAQTEAMLKRHAELGLSTEESKAREAAERELREARKAVEESKKLLFSTEAQRNRWTDRLKRAEDAMHHFSVRDAEIEAAKRSEEEEEARKLFPKGPPMLPRARPAAAGPSAAPSPWTGGAPAVPFTAPEMAQLGAQAGSTFADSFATSAAQLSPRVAGLRAEIEAMMRNIPITFSVQTPALNMNGIKADGANHLGRTSP